MRKFEAGATYGVLHMLDRQDFVTVSSRTNDLVRLTDGREAKALPGIGPDDRSEEVIRLNEQGPIAAGGVVRVCARLAATTPKGGEAA